MLLIVINHCFAVYGGVWASPWDFEPVVPVYKWIQRFAICCTLQLFVFISGYLYAYQSALGKNKEFGPLVKKKLQRLILPCVVFGVIYYLVRMPFSEMSAVSFLKNMNNGMGHLWFLPMLFWCFIFAFLVEKINKKVKITPWLFLLLFFCVSVLSVFVPDYFGLRKAFMYFVYFYFGMLCWDKGMFSSHGNSDKEMSIEKNENTGLTSIISAFSYLILFVLYYYLEDHKSMVDASKAYYLGYKIIEFLTRIVGIMAFMSVATWISNKNIPECIDGLSGLSFGVYIFHQMVIDVLFNRTSLPNVLGIYWLPIVALALSLLISVLLTMAMMKNKCLKKLI